MAYKPVNLIADHKYVNPEEIEVVKDDVILFTNDTNYRFTVIINNAQSVFNPSSKTIIYDVRAGEVKKTPPVKDNPILPLEYQVYIHTEDDIIPSDAPPRIIIVPHE